MTTNHTTPGDWFIWQENEVLFEIYSRGEGPRDRIASVSTRVHAERIVNHVNAQNAELTRLRAEIAELRAEREAEKRDATQLAIRTWEKHYKTTAPDWRPLDDMRGLLSQLSNMLAGWAEREAMAKQEPVYQWRRRGAHIDLPWTDATKEEAYSRVDEYYEARTLFAAPVPIP